MNQSARQVLKRVEKGQAMLNNAPIFINGFQRGGTNILMNLIGSHPDVCLLKAETHQLFYGKNDEPVKKWVRRLCYLPIVIASRQHLLLPSRLYERNGIPRFLMRYIDWVIYYNKKSARDDGLQNAIGKPARPELAGARVVCKNMNGVVFATNLFAEMYPDATFIAIVRNGLALCEGFQRRGWSAERFGLLYEKVCQKMIESARTLPNYHIVRFEDMLADPVACVKDVYSYANLDFGKVNSFRLQAKESMDKDGVRKYTFSGKDREARWFSQEQLGNYFRKDVNENQIARLSPQDREIFLRHARNSMEYFGYL